MYAAQSVTAFREHVQTCSYENRKDNPSEIYDSDIVSNSSSDNCASDDYDDETVSSDNEVTANAQGHRVLGKDYWNNIRMQTVEKIPADIDNSCVYSLKAFIGFACSMKNPNLVDSWKRDSKT